MARKKTTFLCLEDREKIQSLLNKGLAFRTIALSLGRSSNCILREVRNNGGEEIYNALEANERHLRIKTEKYKKFSDKSYKAHIIKKNSWERIKILEEKVSLMEEHINILTETLKEFHARKN